MRWFAFSKWNIRAQRRKRKADRARGIVRVRKLSAYWKNRFVQDFLRDWLRNYMGMQ